MLKFIILEDSDLSDNRYLIDIKPTTGYYKCTLGVLEESKDFNINDEIIRCGSFDSYQLRPKALYKNNKGIYYKKSDGRGYYKKQYMYYLNQEELIELDKFIQKVYSDNRI